MMLCQQILGNIENSRIRDKKIDYVDIEWHEAFKKSIARQQGTAPR